MWHTKISKILPEIIFLTMHYIEISQTFHISIFSYHAAHEGVPGRVPGIYEIHFSYHAAHEGIPGIYEIHFLITIIGIYSCKQIERNVQCAKLTS